MPELARAVFPWLERTGRTYAIGNMGAQESLLLLARGRRDARRVVAFDPVTDTAAPATRSGRSHRVSMSGVGPESGARPATRSRRHTLLEPGETRLRAIAHSGRAAPALVELTPTPCSPIRRANRRLGHAVSARSHRGAPRPRDRRLLAACARVPSPTQRPRLRHLVRRPASACPPTCQWRDARLRQSLRSCAEVPLTQAFCG